MLRRRREPVPYASIAEADRFRSDVPVPPPVKRAGFGEVAGRALVGILIVAGLVGAVVFGVPAMQLTEDPGSAQDTETVRTP
ncbi:hypothetical protein [Streptomyces sp. MAR4 CNX-425]|uniref:hypothetical protein n=1 Tax=Streptomyces sp. MAR4 CNX-425 TaxID=3406343 RepID=UPI003B505AE1